MISKSNYTKEHLEDVVGRYKGNKEIFERVLFAFGMLQSLADVNLDFVFKGGTCLLLLLDNPRRFSTDIDIMVNIDTDIDDFIKEAGKLFPFESYAEHHRVKKNGIEKRHFKFEYISILTNHPANIVLDVVFEDKSFIDTKSIEIKNSLLLTEQPSTFVNVPTVEYLIADKLTAFAPNTIGILYNQDKDLEIIKQMHDVAILFDYVQDFEVVKNAYSKYAEIQIKYRELSCNYEFCLNDTIEACISILSLGEHFGNKQSYVELKGGISKISSHIFDGYSINKAILHSSKVLYIATMVKYNQDLDYVDKVDSEQLLSKNSIYANLNKVRKINVIAFNYVRASILLIDNNQQI